MIDPVAMIEMVRRSDAARLREMGELLIALADRRENSPNFDANMLLALDQWRASHGPQIDPECQSVPTYDPSKGVS